jgi:hypothetical protein
MLEVNVATAADVDDALENAIGLIKVAASIHGTGIMITRTGAGQYIVRAHPGVPYGFIRQQHR